MAIAERAALAGGAVLMDRFGAAASGVSSKTSATDPVSDADRASEAAIRAVITGERPEDAVLGEEGGEKAGSGGDLRWVVDPLDGTVNYLFGLPAWSVSIACEDAAGVLVGVVFDPTRDEIYRAVRGGGALLGDAPLRVRPPSDPALALVATGFSYSAAVRERQAALTARVLPAVRDLRRVGSAALDLAWTAAGRFDAYYEHDVNHWDIAAGALIVREAGGVTAPLEARDGLPAGIIAGSAGVVRALRALVDEA